MTMTQQQKMGSSQLLKYFTEIKRRKLNISTWLLILCTIAAGASIQVNQNIALGFVTSPEQPSCYAPAPDIVATALYLIPTIQFTALALAFPIVGWIGDTKIGRGKAIELSMWSCWLGTLLQVISYCVQYGTCGLPVNIAKYGLSSVAVIFLILGTAGFLSNSLAYGLDQLVDGSSAQIRAYVRWIVWGLFTGFLNDYIAFYNKVIYDASLVLITGLVTFAYTSVMLYLSGSLRHKFEPSYSLKVNPYVMVYNVLKYAKQHKSAVNRSAFTYWEDKIPSRIDLGKHKYGGPFSESEVEDVKTLLQIILILVSTFGVYVPYFTALNGIFPYINKLKGATTDVDGYGSFVLWTIFQESIVVMVPLLELVIIPLLPKAEYFIFNSLKGLGVSYVALFLTLSSMLVIDAMGSWLYNTDCAFNNGSTIGAYDITFLVYIIPLIFMGVSAFCSMIFSFEFICSQSPSNMSGMVTGVFWFIRAAYINVGAILIIPFHAPGLTLGRWTCTSWYLVLQIIICTVGGVIFLYTAKQYQWRKRGEEFFLHHTVERTYDKLLSLQAEDDKTLHNMSLTIDSERNTG